MTIRISQACNIRLNGEVRELKPGETLALDAAKEARLVKAGLARIFTPETKTYRETLTAFEQRDPKGHCWEWITSHHPELWRKHIRAFLTGDISGAHLTFNEMLLAWNGNGANP